MSVWKRLCAALPRLGIAGLIIAFIAGIVAAAYFAAVFPDWTGFGPPPLNAQGEELPHAKTLWDWLGLLLVPLVLAVGGYFLTRSENRYALQLQERREEEARKIEEQRIEEARKLEEQRAQDAALQAYLDQMTELVLHEHLSNSTLVDAVSTVARALTLTALRVLDGARTSIVVQFLYEAWLIGWYSNEDNQVRDFVVDLRDANLQNVALERAYLLGAYLWNTHLDGASFVGASLDVAVFMGSTLTEANFKGASLVKADFENADLTGANFEGATLIGANFRGANFEGTNLKGANLEGADFAFADLTGLDLTGVNLAKADLSLCAVTREQLAEASSLESAKLPVDMAPPQAPGGEITTPKDQAGHPQP